MGANWEEADALAFYFWPARWVGSPPSNDAEGDRLEPAALPARSTVFPTALSTASPVSFTTPAAVPPVLSTALPAPSATGPAEDFSERPAPSELPGLEEAAVGE